MRVYLDNCSYNRPYDDQSQIRIHLETEAKLHIQDMIKDDRLLKYQSPKIQIVTPGEFIRRWEVQDCE